MMPTLAWIARLGRVDCRRVAPLALFVLAIGLTRSFSAQPLQAASVVTAEEVMAEKDWTTWFQAVSSAINASGDRFAGKYSPSRRLTIIRLKGPGLVEPRFADLSTGRLEIRFVSGALFNEEEAAEVVSRAARELSKSCPGIGAGSYDVVSNTFVLDVDPGQRSACRYPATLEGLQLRTIALGRVREL